MINIYSYRIHSALNDKVRKLMKKTVLVTGAASGIGLTCTKLLLERGAKVTAFDPQLEKMVDALGSSDS